MCEIVQIIPVADTGPGLGAELRDWFEQEFGSADRWAAPDYYGILRVGEPLAGRLAILDRRVSAGGVIVRVGGISGVATKPEFRHRGVASALLSGAAEFMRHELSLDFALLLCRREVSPVYAKLGWISVDGPTLFSRGGVTATYAHDTMILPLADKEWPSGLIDMMGLPW
jgi:GNAT superfamily N-acetyltransferase